MKNLVKLFALLLVFAAAIQAQFTYVEPGDSTLRLAVENANDLDVFILRNGGVYTDSGDSTIIVSKNIVIAAEERSGAYPVITNTKFKTGLDNSRADLFTITSGGQLYLQYLELNGLMADTSEYRALGNFISIDGSEMTILLSLELEEVFFNGAMGHIVNGKGNGIFPGPTLLNLAVGYCLITNSKGFYFEEVGLTTFGINSSTAWNINGPLVEFINDQGNLTKNANPSVVGFDYCTFDNIGPGFANATNATGMWIVKNSIYTNQVDTGVEMFSDVSQTSSEFNHNNFFNTGAPGFNEAFMADNYQVDPEYADAANGNFTLPAASILLTATANGYPIGDPRWAQDVTGIDDENTPVSFSLGQNYPNPFNPSTEINFSIPVQSYVSLKIYDLNGRLVKTLANENFNSGTHKVRWNSFNNDGLKVSSGIYFYTLNTGSFAETKKMMLIK